MPVTPIFRYEKYIHWNDHKVWDDFLLLKRWRILLRKTFWNAHQRNCHVKTNIFTKTDELVFFQKFSREFAQIKNIWTQQISEVLKFFNTCIESIVDKIATKIAEPTFTSIHHFHNTHTHITFGIFVFFSLISSVFVQGPSNWRFGEKVFLVQFNGARESERETMRTRMEI